MRKKSLTFSLILIISGLSWGSAVTLTDPGVVQGKVAGLDNGSSATVQLLSLGDRSCGSFPNKTSTQNGAFRFEQVRPGPHMLYIQLEDGMRGRPLYVRPGAISDVAIDLEEGLPVEGHIRVDGEPLANARVGFTFHEDGGRMVHVNADGDETGRFSTTLPVPGLYDAKLERLNGSELRGQSVIRIAIGDEGPQTVDLDFFAGEIRGRVVDFGGRPLKDSEIRLFGFQKDAPDPISIPSRGYLADWQVGADGNFRIEALSPGTYRLDVRAKGHGTRTFWPLAIEEDETTDLGDVALGLGTGLRVVAQDHEGQPLERATVAAFPGEGLDAIGFPSTASTGETGAAWIEGLEPGSYTVVASYPGLAPAVVSEVEAPSSDAETVLHLEPGGALDIRFSSHDGRPLSGFQARLFDDAGRDVTSWYVWRGQGSGELLYSDTNGLQRLRHLRPGVYRVGFENDSPDRRKAVVVTRGSTSVVFLTQQQADGSD